MENENLKLSIIIPVYNEIEYLEKCVSSVCSQTYKNLEIILVDDGSSSPCCEMCDSYLLKDKRIKVFHKKNGGSISARRKGIEEAAGDYVAFVDSDDWVEPDLYKEMLEIANGNDPDMVAASNYYRNYTEEQSINAYDSRRSGFWKKEEFVTEVFPYFIKTEEFFDTEFPIPMWAYLFKTDFANDVIQKIEDKIKTAEDYVFTMLAFLNAKSFAATTYRGYHYRSNMKSKTHTINNVKKFLYPVYETINDAIKKSDYNFQEQAILKKKNRLPLYHAFMIRDYRILFEVEDDFLFPYSKVKKGSKIFIYGAGQLGKQIYNVLKDKTDYEVVGVADRNWQLYKGCEIDIVAPEKMLSLDYDYVIIAIIYANIKKEVKDYLLEMGVEKNKIAEVDMNVMDENHLPF